MHNAIKILKTELAKHKSRKYRINAQPFFKEKLDNPWMLRGAVFKKISAAGYKELKGMSKKEVLDICDEVLATNLEARQGFAFDWAWRQRKHFEPKDFARFERWVKREVSNWGACDSICCRALGHLLLMYPELIPRTKKWARSRNMWQRRASAVCLIPSLRKGQTHRR